MDLRFLLTFLAFIASVLTVMSLKKEILNLPPIIHFTDVFNTQHSENEKTNIFSSGSSYPHQQGYQQGSWHSGWPNSGQSGQSGYHSHHHHSGYPWQSGYPPYGYPQQGYPQHGYPPVCHQQGGHHHHHHRPRQEDVEVVERYFKFNDDGSKEYKLILNNGLNIYQKILTSNGDDKQNIEMLEGYYSDKRDDGTYITTYFKADNTGYSASSEIKDSPPDYPNLNGMMRVTEEFNKTNTK